ncbi:MAG: Pvc16 family protein [Cycloclasticus sp.]|jgi:hypothetical protein
MDPLILQKMQQALKALITEKVISLDEYTNSDAVALSFLAPSGDFVAELTSIPTINCYLIGMSEDKDRRKSESHRSTINTQKTIRTVHREPKFIDLSYMLTVWCKDKEGSAEIEHLILGYLLCGLGMYDFMPADIQQRFDINISPYGVAFKLFGNEQSDKISGQIWQAMGSTPKPCLMLSLSVPVDVHEPLHLPLVQEIKRTLDTH